MIVGIVNGGLCQFPYSPDSLFSHLRNALQHVINGSAHHSDHHTAYNYNYGQYFTLWDRLGGSYRHPSALYGKG
jgi:sterol desaturase/sphingolipid hydroxylase (fatty acid hydroxylase superfamily)